MRRVRKRSGGWFPRRLGCAVRSSPTARTWPPRCRQPRAQNLAFPVPGDAERDADGLVPDHPAVGIADLHPQCVKDHDGIHPVERPALPLAHLARNGIGHAADQVGRDLQSLQILKMGLDVAYRKPGGIGPVRQRARTDGDSLAHSCHPPRRSGSGPSLPVGARSCPPGRAAQPAEPRRPNPSPAAWRHHSGGWSVRAAAPRQDHRAQMRGKFGTEHPLHQTDLQLLHQPGVTRQILRSLAAFQQLVQQFVRIPPVRTV
jgi:hypothetical protein